MPKKVSIEEGDRTEDDAEPPKDDSHIARDGDYVVGEDDPEARASEEPSPKTVKLTLGGREVELPEDTALAIQEETSRLQRSYDDSLAALSASSGEPAPEPEEEDRYSELLYTDPKSFVDHLKEELRTELTSEYNIEQARRDFWTEFYSENSDLTDERHLVETTLNANMSALQNMSGRPARDKLAEMTKAEILRITNKHSKGASKAAGADLEGSDSSSEPSLPDTPPKKEPARPHSLGDAIKQRRLDRRRTSRQAQA